MTDLSLLQDFIVETVEYLEEMEGSLLRLEADPGNRMMLDDVFRAVHTIKGAAEYLGIERISELSSKIETVLYRQQRRSELAMDQEMIDLLMAGRERIGQLTENLQQTQAEEVGIDDLIERLQALDTTSQISEDANQSASDAEATDITDEMSDDIANETAAFEANEEEEEEELFAIFLDQLEESLTELQNQTTALQEADSADQIAILELCLAQIDPLLSSANYMGYDQLTSFYEKWEEEIQVAIERLQNHDDGFIPAFIKDCLQDNIVTLTDRYPRIQIPEPLKTPVTPESSETTEEDNPPTIEPEIFCDSDVDDDDDDDESRDILEEYAEAHEITNEDAASDANLFDQLSWSFDSRIKQNTTKQTESNQTEIESELFSTAESPQPPPAASAEPTAEVVAEAPVLVAPTAEDAEIPSDVNVEVADLTVVDDYEEEMDEELFGIFLEQLEENLGDLRVQTAALQETDNKDHQIDILDVCLERIDLLSSSANYMGYEQLASFYEVWTKDVGAARARLYNGENGFISVFITDCMQANITDTVSLFPRLNTNEETQITTEPIGPTETTTTSIPVTESDLIPDKEIQIGEICTESRPAMIIDISMLPDFIIETREHLEVMEDNLLRLDTDSGGRETLDDIFRSIHTIKGAAEYLGIERIAKLTHNLENLLYQLRQNELKVNRDIIDLLMAVWDRISLLIGNLEQTQAEQAEIDDLLERIRVMGSSSQDTEMTEPVVDGTTPKTITTNEMDEKALLAAAEAALKSENAALLRGTDRRGPDQEIRRRSDQVNEKTLKQSIRVDASKIDSLMNQVGELVVSRAGFTQLLTDMRTLQQELKQNFKLDIREMRQFVGMTTRLSEATSLFSLVTNELQEEIMKVRMLPISQLFNRYSRLVFDLIRNSDKKVNLEIHGEETELDKMVIEEIADPLIHIIRNAVDHGIGTTAQRRKVGKSETGTIRLEAYHEGNHVVIEIMDDGQGLNLDRIREKALAGKFVSPDELEQMSTRELTGLIMIPGFSTATSVTNVSGRGVGMDVVKRNIEKLNGTIEIDTTPSVETRFRIKLPLTLAIIPALRVKVGMELFTIPLSTVEETLRIYHDDISTIEGVEVMSFRKTTLPLVRLTSLFNLETTASDTLRHFVVVVSTGMTRMGLVVDDLLGQEEVVIKPLEDYLQERSGFSGATILGDGRISLILDVYELIDISINREAKNKASAHSV